MSRELFGHVGAPHTPAGTFSLALARISWRSVVKLCVQFSFEMST